jgi:hypothetical protein
MKEEEEKKSLRVVRGNSGSVSDRIDKMIPNGAAACAIDLVKSRTS